MDKATLKSFKKKYFFAPIMLFYMKHCNYEKLKPKLIRAGMGHIRNENKEEIAYAQEMFESVKITHFIMPQEVILWHYLFQYHYAVH